MKNTHAFFLFLMLIGWNASAQETELTLIESYTYQDLMELAVELGVPTDLINIQYPVDYYKINYASTDAWGEAVELSGAVALPHGANCALPLVNYQHGTVTLQTNVPSQMNQEGILGILFATTGFVVTMPDYHGLGDHEVMHPYVHAETQASAGLDIITSTIDELDNLGMSHNGQYFLWGYSQGGHASMALHKRIEDLDLFDVTASAPMSGPYDMNSTQFDFVFNDEDYPSVAYVPYLILGYQSVYGDIYEDLADVFVSPYDETVEDLFDGSYALGDLAGMLPGSYTELLTDSFQIAIQDTLHPLRQAMELNNLYDWSPEAPTRLYYCGADEQVAPDNSTLAEDTFIENGAPDVSSENLGPWTHSVCALFALLECYDWFISLADLPQIEAEFQIYNATGSDSMDGAIFTVADDWQEYDFMWEDGSEEKDREQLNAGIYELTITDNDACSIIYEFEIDIAAGHRRSSLERLEDLSQSGN